MWKTEPDKYNHKLLSHFCFSVLCFCLLVILWGAWVRISHSGEGCGQNWPSCHGRYLIDSEAPTKTWIEWIHRSTSSIFGMLVLLLSVLCFRQNISVIRKTVLYVLFFTISEALIGASLVLTGLTGNNTSLMRIFIMNLHLLNSILLVSSLCILWRLLKGKRFLISSSFKHKKYFFSVLFVFFVIIFFGSISALASSVFPTTSLLKGIALDFNSHSHWLIRLRILHPILAILAGNIMLFYGIFYTPLLVQNKSKTFKIIMLFIILVLFSGLINLLFLSPVFLKLLHLCSVYLLIIFFIRYLEHFPKHYVKK